MKQELYVLSEESSEGMYFPLFSAVFSMFSLAEEYVARHCTGGYEIVRVTLDPEKPEEAVRETVKER